MHESCRFVKFLVILICSWSCIFSPIAYGADDESGRGPEDCEEFADNSASCQEQGLLYNCHVKKCVSQTSHDMYSAAYEGCDEKKTEDEKNKCKAELENVAVDIAVADAVEESGKNLELGGEGKDTAADVATTGAAIATAGIYAQGVASVIWGCANLSNPCPVTTSGAAMTAFLIAAFVYATVTMKEGYRDQFDNAMSSVENISLNQEDNGWAKETQIATMTALVTALKNAKKAADDKAQFHTMMSIILLIFGIVCLVLACTPAAIADWCLFIAGCLSIVASVLEFTAAEQTKKVSEKASSSIKLAEMLIEKFQRLFHVSNEDLASYMAKKYQSDSQGGNASQGPQKVSVRSSGGAKAEKPGKDSQKSVSLAYDKSKTSNSDGPCITNELEGITCPCPEEGCYSYTINLSNDAYSTQVSEELDLPTFQEGLDDFYSGDHKTLNKYANGKTLSALAPMLREVIKNTLESPYANKIKQKEKDVLEAIYESYPKMNKVMNDYAQAHTSPLKVSAFKSLTSGDKALNKIMRKIGSIDPTLAGGLGLKPEKEEEEKKKEEKMKINLPTFSRGVAKKVKKAAPDEYVLEGGITKDPGRSLWEILTYRYKALILRDRFAD
jgi:hypothetical protein